MCILIRTVQNNTGSICYLEHISISGIMYYVCFDRISISGIMYYVCFLYCFQEYVSNLLATRPIPRELVSLCISREIE